MPEHLPFPDVAGPAARATQPPPFDEILNRARRRRRRALLATTAVVAAAVVAVAAGATLATGDDGSAPQPVGPSPSTTTAAPSTSPAPTPAPGPAADPAEVVRDGRLVSMAVNAKGSLLTVWQRCHGEGQRCRTAWQLQGRAGITRALVTGNFAAAQAAGDSIVVTSWDHPGVVVDVDGQARALQRSAPGTTAPGDALVRLGRALAVVDPVAASYWTLPVPVGVESWVDGTIAPDGTIWATPSIPAPPIDVRVSWHDPGSAAAAWHHHPISTTFNDGPGPGPMAVANDHVAALSMHDGVDIASFGRFAVTTDAGASWSDLRPGDLPFDNVDAMAATSGGTLYVAAMDSAGQDRVFRSTDATWRHFAEVPGARGAYRLVPAGKRVVAARGPMTRPEVLALDETGRATVWAEFR